MPRRVLPSGLRPRLLLLILFTMSGSMALLFSQALQQRREALGSAASEAMLLSRLAAAHEEREVAVARQFLEGLALEEPVRQRDAVACRQLLASLRESGQPIATVSMLTADGRVFASSDWRREGRDLSKARWFTRAMARRAFTVSDYTAEPLELQSTLRCAEPVEDDEGRIVAVVTATLDRDWFGRAAARARLPEHTSFLVVDRNGAVITQHPQLASARPDSSVTPFRAPRDGEWLQTVRGGDGVLRIVAFAPLEGSSDRAIFVGVGIDRDAVLAQATRAFWGSLALMLLLGTVVSMVALRGARVIVLRRLEVILKATERLRQGDLSARTGLPYGTGELSRLARGFDHMAGALQRQNAARARFERQLRLSEARKAAVLEASHDGILVLDALGCVLECNAAAKRMFGFGPEDCPERALADLFVGPFQGKDEFARRPGVPFEAVARRANGSEFPGEVSIAPIHGEAGHGLHVATVRDITERKFRERALEEMTFVDELTGLYNRRGFAMFASQQLRLAARTHQNVVLVSIDVDGLKRINDTYGHAEGDRALGEIGVALRNSFREADVIGRQGGDEFVVLATETDQRGAEHALERFAEVLAQRNARDDRAWKLGASIGWLRTMPVKGVTLPQLLAQADERMYEQKRGHRGPGEQETPGARPDLGPAAVRRPKRRSASRAA